MTQPPNPSRPAMTEAEREAMVADARDAYRDPSDIVRPELKAGPWKRPCSSCAFHPHDPQRLSHVMDDLIAEVASNQIDFYCVHRATKSGLHRVCASAAVIAARANQGTPA